MTHLDNLPNIVNAVLMCVEKMRIRINARKEKTTA